MLPYRYANILDNKVVRQLQGVSTTPTKLEAKFSRLNELQNRAKDNVNKHIIFSSLTPGQPAVVNSSDGIQALQTCKAFYFQTVKSYMKQKGRKNKYVEKCLKSGINNVLLL